MNAHDLNVWLGAGVIGVGALLAYIAQRNKNQINKELAELRAEIRETYVQQPVDMVRHDSLSERISGIERELERLRNNVHELRDRFQLVLMTKLDEMQREILDRMRELERR